MLNLFPGNFAVLSIVSTTIEFNVKKNNMNNPDLLGILVVFEGNTLAICYKSDTRKFSMSHASWADIASYLSVIRSFSLSHKFHSDILLKSKTNWEVTFKKSIE